jgi:hypothetical protein
MMRFAVLSALIAVTLASAQTPRSVGCPLAVGTSGLFANTTSPCAQQTACETGFDNCLWNSALKNCTLASMCVGARIECMMAAAANTSGCVGLNGLHTSLLKVAAGDQQFSESDAYKSCAATACLWLNSSYLGFGTNCALNFGTLCPSPIFAVVSLLFRGNFTSPVTRQSFAGAVALDMSRAFALPTRTRRVFIAGARRQSEQTIAVEIEVVGTSNNNAAFKTIVGRVAADAGWYLPNAASR